MMKLKVEYIRLVEDPHEILFHTMEAMVVTLAYNRGPPVCYNGKKFDYELTFH